MARCPVNAFINHLLRSTEENLDWTAWMTNHCAIIVTRPPCNYTDFLINTYKKNPANMTKIVLGLAGHISGQWHGQGGQGSLDSKWQVVVKQERTFEYYTAKLAFSIYESHKQCICNILILTCLGGMPLCSCSTFSTVDRENFAVKLILWLSPTMKISHAKK